MKLALEHDDYPIDPKLTIEQTSWHIETWSLETTMDDNRYLKLNLSHTGKDKSTRDEMVRLEVEITRLKARVSELEMSQPRDLPPTIVG